MIADGVTHHLDGEDQPRAVLPLALYTRLRAIEAAALEHVDACGRLARADGAYASKHPTIAARAAAMGALLVARGGVVDTSGALAKAVSE